MIPITPIIEEIGKVIEAVFVLYAVIMVFYFYIWSENYFFIPQ